MIQKNIRILCGVGICITLVSASWTSRATENSTTPPFANTTVMFVVSATETALDKFFQSVKNDNRYKSGSCALDTNMNSKPGFLIPKNGQKMKYRKRFVECKTPSADTFQLFGEASLEASDAYSGRPVKVLSDTLTISPDDGDCKRRYCNGDNSYHQAFPTPASACGYCP